MIAKIVLFVFPLLFSTSLFAQQVADLLKEKAPINRDQAIYQYVTKHVNDEKELLKGLQIASTKGTASDKLSFEFYLENSKTLIAKQIDLINKYLLIAKAQENHCFVSTLYLYKAISLRSKNQFASALENYLYAYDATKKDKTGAYFNNSYLFHQMGLAFLEFKDFDKALLFGLLAHQTKYFNDPNKLENWLPKATANLIGEAYRNLNKPDSAIYWFKVCFNKSQGNRFLDTLWRGISLGSIAEMYADKKDYTKALDYYLQGKAWHIGHDNSLIDYNISTFSNLAKVYLAVNNVIEADKCLKTAASFLPKREYNNSALKYYQTLIDFYKYKQVNAYLLLNATDSFQHYNTIVAKEFNEKQKISTEATMAFNNQLLKTQIAESNYKKTRITLIGTIGMAVLLIVIAILYTIRKNLLLKLQQQELENEQQKAKEALTLAQIQLQDFAKNIQDKNKLIAQFSEEVDNLKLQWGEKANEKEEIIDKLKQSVILTEDDWQDYKVMFDKVHPQYIENIKAQFASITNAELRYLMLTKLKLDNKEMAATLGIGLEGVRGLKFRVKNKIGIDTEFFEA